MSKSDKSSIYPIKVAKSFKHAFRGIALSLEERNMQVHVIAVVVVTVAGVFLKINPTEWALILICIGAVLATEILNTSIEAICDNLRDDLKLSYGATRDARDLASGAVLISAIVSVFVAIFIFLPKIFELF